MWLKQDNLQDGGFWVAKLATTDRIPARQGPVKPGLNIVFFLQSQSGE